MKRKWFLLSLTVVLAFVLAACGGSSTPAPSGGENTASAPAASGGETEPASAAPAESPAAAEPANAQPVDVPVMEGAYDLSIERSGTQMRYKVDSEVQTVVDFYHSVLPGQGWEIKGPPDSVVGNIASMLRENKAGDRLSINMQYNPNAQFTVVTIAISRK